MTGKVYLVGAGPGDPELITVKGLRCLRQAEVLLYDRLVAPALLEEAPRSAERVFVGKAPGRPRRAQEEIHRLMIDRARRGLTVVRLKGGDPFVFGRGGEEVLALAAAGVPFEVVPGVTSAVGVPGRAGIPLTHRGLSESFAVVTGHQAQGAAEPDWEALARVDTLVILMGVKRLPSVASALQRSGREPDTPVAIVERGTWPEERLVLGTLATIADQAALAGVRPPAVIVVGEVVRLAGLLNTDGQGSARRRAEAPDGVPRPGGPSPMG